MARPGWQMCYNAAMIRTFRIAPLRLLLTVLLALLVCRFVLLAVGSDPTSPLVGLLLAAGGLVAAPCQPFFAAPYVGTPGLDFASLLAAALLLLGGGLLYRFFPRLF